jgi:hypothetical protein
MAASPSPVPVTVNFNIEIDASGNLNVFSAPAQAASNVIVALYELPVKALYDPENNKGLLELWEPSTAQGDISVQLADTDRATSGGLNLAGAYQHAAKQLATGLEAVLCNEFDCSGAAPFSAANYKSSDKYYKQRDFGRVALATYAHHLFGHVDATAAITNDAAFVEAMLSLNTGAGASEVAADRVTAYKTTKLSAINTTNVQDWDGAASTTDANLAIRLVKMLVQKGLDASGTVISSVNAGDSGSLANIVSQVVGQDASRLMGVDNSQRTLDQHILLRFYAGDVIYVNITLKAPNVSVGTGQKVQKSALEAMYPTGNNNFSLKITLGNGTGVSSTPAPAPAPTPTDPNVSRLVYQSDNSAYIVGTSGPIVGSLVIPTGVQAILNNALANQTQMTSITLPSGFQTFGNGALSGCTGLTSISLPSSMGYIGQAAFQGCTGLTSITIPSSITNIYTNTFNGCTSLTSITIPSSVTAIYDYAFASTGLTSVNLPTDMYYSYLAFPYSCVVTTPNSIRYSPFTYNNNTKTVLKKCDANVVGAIVIPSTVTSISEGAFGGFTDSYGTYTGTPLMTSVTIPSSVTHIHSFAFQGCTVLTSITIPSSVTYIGEGAFNGCSAATSISITAPLTSIGDNAFAGCTMLSSVTIPYANVYGSGIFSYCSGLTNIIIPETITTIPVGMFSNCTSLGDTVTIPGNVTSIESLAFADCTSIIFMFIPQGCTFANDALPSSNLNFQIYRT